MVEKVHISWNEFHQDTKLLAEKIKADGEYNKIIAVSRGGLLPAAIVSYELDIRNTHAINISSYDGEQQRQVADVKIDINIGEVDNHTIIIDDLSDTGATIKLLRNLFPNARVATVYAKPSGINDVDIFAKKMPDKWLVFPWDI